MASPNGRSHLDPHNLDEHNSYSAQRRANRSSRYGQTGLKPTREPMDRPNASSSALRKTPSPASTHSNNRWTQRDVRSLPPWIDSYEEPEDPLADALPSDELLSSPSRAHSAQHHYTPTQPSRRLSKDGFMDIYDENPGTPEKKPDIGIFGHKEPVKGRKWDHARDGDPVILKWNVEPSSPWRAYIQSSKYGPARSEQHRKAGDELLQQQTPGFNRPWRGDLDGGNDPEKSLGLLRSKKRRRSWLQRWQNILLMHPLIPLIFRIIVFTTSVIALGLSASIYQLSIAHTYPQSPSTTMAVIVDVVAIPYILYVTWDEYTGKPLGLRPPRGKMRLVLLDVFFIIFESANLALSFAALADDNGSCGPAPDFYNHVICGRVRALSGILMIALIGWGVTFTISIFRLVERVGGREEAE